MIRGTFPNFTTIWSNLLIGRRAPRPVSPGGHAENSSGGVCPENPPWDKVVFDLVSAEGHF
ncbi:MAG: hypothetical protein CM1200mP2_00870 [Planctomycetaceae bacterium]|nr:MAG: hypothetical protein CM1200mP2_00870 [Planctomycetaceae bacterium]